MTTKTEAPPVDQPVVETDDAQAEADFAEGAAAEGPGPKKTQAPDDGQPPRDEAGRFVEAKPAEKPAAKPEEKPEYVQITKQQFDRFMTAATRTDDIEGRFSKVFGTMGDVQKIVKTLQTQTPRGVAVKIPDDAFAAMEKDFPELAAHTRSALEATLKGIEGTGSASAQVDTEAFEAKIEERVLKLAAEDLEDEYPDWRTIVGAVDTRKGEKPDENQPFRKWLATKPKEYQDRVSGSMSAGVITRAIRAFKSETKAAPAAAPAPAKPNPQAVARAARIAEAVRPKGDGGQPPAKNADDDFEAGFKTG